MKNKLYSKSINGSESCPAINRESLGRINGKLKDSEKHTLKVMN